LIEIDVAHVDFCHISIL